MPPTPDPGPPITPAFLLEAYRHGYFPMAESRADTGPLGWYNPPRRAIIPLDGFHLPRRLRDRLRSGRFAITSNTAFGGVIRACAEPRASERDTWINAEIVALYSQLHEQGSVHSIEVRLSADGSLVGGIYGVQVGAVFCAESKFSRPAQGGTDASKAALAHLILHLKRRGFAMLDVQVYSDHLAQFGCMEIPRREYMRIMDSAGTQRLAWEPFDPAANLELMAKLGMK